MKNKSIILNLLTLAAVAAFTGCATSGYKQADKTGEGIAEFRDAIVNGKKAIDAHHEIPRPGGHVGHHRPPQALRAILEGRGEPGIRGQQGAQMQPGREGRRARPTSRSGKNSSPT